MNATAEAIEPLPPSAALDVLPSVDDLHAAAACNATVADQPISRVVTIPPAAPDRGDPAEPLFELPNHHRVKLSKCLTEGSAGSDGNVPSNFGTLIERLRLYAGEIEGDHKDAGLTVPEKRRKDLAERMGPLKQQIRDLSASLKRLCEGNRGHGQRMSVTDFFLGWEREAWDLTYAPPAWHLVVGHVGRVHADWIAGALPEDAVVRTKLLWALRELRRHRRDTRGGRHEELTAIITSETRSGYHAPECECARCVVVTTQYLRRDPYAAYRRALERLTPAQRFVIEEHYGDYGIAWRKLALKFGQLGSLFWLTAAGRRLFAEAMAERSRRGQPAYAYTARDWFQQEAFSKPADVAKLLEKKKTEQRSVLDNRTRIERARRELEKQAAVLLAAADAALFDLLQGEEE